MTITERISNSIKVLLHGAKALPFSALGGTYGFNGYSGGSLPGWGFSFQGSLPGSQYDDATAAGALWENPAAAACFVALTKAFAQARPYLEKRKTKDGNDWERVGHELIELIERPNPFYSGEKLFGVTLICAMSQGAAFWRIERDRRGMPAEIWYEPPVGIGASGISPDWDSENFISRYWYFVDGQRQTAPLPIEDVVYFRHGLNVANPRMPWSPLGLGSREIAVLNSASTYTAAVLRNYGAPAGFIGMEVGENGANPTPQQAEELKRHIEAKFGGAQNAGKTFVSPLPWKWNKVGMTPAEMVIDQIRQWPQETVCALLGTPVICALLPTGAQPTYQNLESSMKWWWDNTITPLEDSFADEIETQLFPAFDLDTNEYRISWDRSKVPALQDDEVATHTMWRADYQAGLIDRATFLDKIGEKPTPEDEGVYFGQPQNEQEQNVQELIRQGGVGAAKSTFNGLDSGQRRAGMTNGTLSRSAALSSSSRSVVVRDPESATKAVILEPLPESFYLKVIDRNGASHDELGRFDGGSGGDDNRYPELGEASAFWGGNKRDETTQKYFNGDYEVTVNDGVNRESKKLFGRELDSTEYGQLIGAPDGEKVQVYAIGDGSIFIQGDEQGFFTLLMRRVGGQDGELVMENQALSKKDGAPAQLAPRMLAYQFKKCQELGISKVVTRAIGNAQAPQTGYSRWPQLGFNGEIDENVRKKMSRPYNSARNLNDLMRMEGGFEMWKKYGKGDVMEFDLNKNSPSWRIFEAYLKGKGIKMR